MKTNKNNLCVACRKLHWEEKRAEDCCKHLGKLYNTKSKGWNMNEDIKLYIEWLSLREYSVRNEKTKRERELHLYFKSKYGVRLFETSYMDVLNKIEETIK